MSLPLQIDVVDSRAPALTRCLEYDFRDTKIVDLRCHKDFNSLETTYDLTIVATPADDRDILLERLAAVQTSYCWIIEKILAQSPRALQKIQRVFERQSNVWVNHPRRVMSLYKEVYKWVQLHGTVFSIQKTGSRWGMASNTVHLLDLMSWLSGQKIIKCGSSRVRVSSSKSNRPGYLEFEGTIVAEFEKGVIRLSCGPNFIDSGLKITCSDGAILHVNEVTEMAVDNLGNTIRGRMEYQSELTPLIAYQALTRERVGLTPIVQAIEIHESFLKSLRRVKSSRIRYPIPIT